MPIIRVEMFVGRNRAQKAKITKALTDAFIDSAGGNPVGVRVRFTDASKGDWPVGGTLIADRGAS